MDVSIKKTRQHGHPGDVENLAQDRNLDRVTRPGGEDSLVADHKNCVLDRGVAGSVDQSPTDEDTMKWYVVGVHRGAGLAGNHQ